MSPEPVVFDITELVSTVGGGMALHLQRLSDLGVPVKAIALPAHLWPDYLPPGMLFLGCQVVRLTEPGPVQWGVVT